MPELDVIIPARNEVYLQKTIESVLTGIEGDTGVIAILDGYWPDPPILDHPRVTLIHHTESIGQRAAINEAVRLSKAKYIMKIDAHCAVAKGFDVVLMNDWQPGWTIVPRMHNLDRHTWQPKLHKRTDYMYIGWNDRDELRTLYYEGNEYRRKHRITKEIDETMSCMGPGWFLSKEDFWKQGGCDEGHGGWGQQGIEVALKAWLSGGALMVDKRTWFAHWFRASDGGFPYPVSGNEHDYARRYSRDLWINSKWPQQIRSLRWLVEKFNPPGWDQQHLDEIKEPSVLTDPNQIDINKLTSIFYKHVHDGKRWPTWKGIKVVKLPSDLALYAEIIQTNRPKYIIEAGTRFGGSALFFQDMLDLNGDGGKVVTIEKYPKKLDIHHDPRITYIEDSSTNREVVQQVKDMVGTDPVMVVLDSDHSRIHVKWELHYWAPLVTPGQFIVVEDCYDRDSNMVGPGEAVKDFLERNSKFERVPLEERYLVGFCRGGWLRRKS